MPDINTGKIGNEDISKQEFKQLKYEQLKRENKILSKISKEKSISDNILYLKESINKEMLESNISHQLYVKLQHWETLIDVIETDFEYIIKG